MKIRNNKIRKVLLTAVLSLMISFSTYAQVFVIDGANQRNSINSNIENLEVPEIGSGNDHGYLPLGNGCLLMVALGGAYLLGKTRNSRPSAEKQLPDQK